MKTVKLATLARILGSSSKLPQSAMTKKLLRKSRGVKVKMSTLPRSATK